jgi:hypothetical protein
MRVKRRVCRNAAVIAVTLLASLLVAAGDVQSDQSAQRRWSRDWVPSFALSGTFYSQSQMSTLASECAAGGLRAEPLARCSQGEVPVRDSADLVRDARKGVPTLHPDGPYELRDPAAASDLTVWPGVGIDFQLMSPHILSPRGPRIFMGAEFVATFPPQRAIANEGALTELEFPQKKPDPTTFPALGFAGLGAEVLSKPRTFHYGAQIGLAIPIRILNRTIRIKPSFAWLNYRLDVKGNLLAVVKDDVNGITLGNISTYGANLRLIDLSDRETRTINAIGPGMEIELDSIRSGSFGISMFTSLHAYRLLTDRNVKLAAEVFYPDGTAPGGDGLLADTYRARWSHQIKPWVFRLRVGMRFHYFGD